MSKKILGIDPGLSKTGYAVITEDCKYVKSGIIKLDKKLTVIGKVKEIVSRLKDIIEKNSIDIICIEKPIFNRLNPDSYFKQAETFGILRYEFIEYDYSNHLYVFMPNEIKKHVGVKGKHTSKESKELVKNEVIDIFGLQEHKFKSMDESDALAIAYSYIVTGGQNEL